VGAIANEAGIEGRSIGTIEILDHTAFVEVPKAEASNVVQALRRTKLRGRKAKVQIARPFEERW
jgi:ATP-dependent RNA helicase DeaD